MVCERDLKLHACERKGTRVESQLHQHHLIIKGVTVLKEDDQALHNAADSHVEGQRHGEQPKQSRATRPVGVSANARPLYVSPPRGTGQL